MLASHFLLNKTIMEHEFAEILAGVFDATAHAKVSEELAVRVALEYQSAAPLCLRVDHVAAELSNGLINPFEMPSTIGDEWAHYEIFSEAGVCDVVRPMRWSLEACCSKGNAAKLRNVVVSLAQVDP